MQWPRAVNLLSRMMTVGVLGGAITLVRVSFVSGADLAAPPQGAARPKIVRVVPGDGALDVGAVAEIRIRFDQPMDPTRGALDWKLPGEAGFRVRGALRYEPDTHEFVLPVYLTPGRKHEVTVNRDEPFKQGGFEGFRSASGLEAASSTWSFTTAERPDAGEGPAPRVVSITPRPDTEIALLTPLEVTFDRPMDPTSYGLAPVGADPFDSSRKPKLQGRADYDDRACRFTLLVKLPAQWNGEFRLEGFRDADGVKAGPITLKYRTLRTPLAPALQQKIERAGRGPSPELRRIVARVRDARRGLTSVSEQVLTTMTIGTLPDWHYRYDLKGASFKMHGARKFVANIDGVMGIPFRIGSDGRTCWFRAKDTVVELPFEQVDEKNLLFCDPFHADGDDDVDHVIRDRKLEYLGEAVIRERRCFQIRSCDIKFLTADITTPMVTWLIDAETFLPVRVEMDDTFAMDFLDVRINEPIRDEDFRPSVAPDVNASKVDPLPDGYTRRFLNVNDGSGGRMSVRWGMKGPKGTNSSGLN